MAPELLAGGAATPASDQYSLGVLLFRLATGRYPIAADTLEQLESRHREAETPRWQAQDPPGRPLRELVERLLSRDPATRPTASEAGAMVRAITAEPARRRRRLAIAAIVALALGLTRRPATSAVATGPAPAAPMAAMSPTANAEAILAERLARSEITSDDYRTMLAALRGGPDAPAAPGVDAPAG